MEEGVDNGLRREGAGFLAGVMKDDGVKEVEEVNGEGEEEGEEVGEKEGIEVGRVRAGVSQTGSR